MKNLLFLLGLGLGVMTFAQAGPPAGEAKVGEFYGKDVETKVAKKAISVSNLNKKLTKEAKVENIAVKGTVTEVCPKKGCWVKLKSDEGKDFFVKMKDYAFFVPEALVGKTVVMEGNAESKTTSVNELKHYAEDAKKSQEEIDAIKEPKTETRFLASAIKVVK
ncbi:DUF4920 domain-containing protein [Chryseobacterium sp. POL2]|uniref:DUF4920 domain-containing protein n=1 Tax=Chryseobacterium sp. POL2 TaxID=2713414 RepID=UPI0013E10CD2|nr:DUF4920 domain-containing protein [Chryseobacterium sp. POL2]QIG88931.1 DUF4920 domain-containing protein [Chryseobacterium sp. POL2]